MWTGPKFTEGSGFFSPVPGGLGRVGWRAPRPLETVSVLQVFPSLCRCRCCYVTRVVSQTDVDPLRSSTDLVTEKPSNTVIPPSDRFTLPFPLSEGRYLPPRVCPSLCPSRLLRRRLACRWNRNRPVGPAPRLEDLSSTVLLSSVTLPGTVLLCTSLPSGLSPRLTRLTRLETGRTSTMRAGLQVRCVVQTVRQWRGGPSERLVRGVAPTFEAGTGRQDCVGVGP